MIQKELAGCWLSGWWFEVRWSAPMRNPKEVRSTRSPCRVDFSLSRLFRNVSHLISAGQSRGRLGRPPPCEAGSA